MFRGRVYKEGKYWMIEVTDLDLMTQGRTKEEAYDMLIDLLVTATESRVLKLDIARHSDNTFLLGGRDEPTEKVLIALLLRRQRVRAGLSLRDMERLLKAKSKNAYARYEHGESLPSSLKMQRFLRAMGLNLEMRVRGRSMNEEISASC